MNRASGEILETARVEPVTLTKRDREKLIILTAEQYRRLLGRSTRWPTAWTTRLNDELMSRLDQLLDDDRV